MKTLFFYVLTLFLTFILSSVFLSYHPNSDVFPPFRHPSPPFRLPSPTFRNHSIILRQVISTSLNDLFRHPESSLSACPERSRREVEGKSKGADARPSPPVRVLILLLLCVLVLLTQSKATARPWRVVARSKRSKRPKKRSKTVKFDGFRTKSLSGEAFWNAFFGVRGPFEG